MQLKRTLFPLVFLAALITMPMAQAGEASISTMASILINLQHFPSDSDKEKLAMIASSDDSSEAEKTIAMAIANIEHQASSADKDKLNAIIADSDTPAGLRDLANVVVSLNHYPSAADKTKLEKLVVAL